MFTRFGYRYLYFVLPLAALLLALALHVPLWAYEGSVVAHNSFNTSFLSRFYFGMKQIGKETFSEAEKQTVMAMRFIDIAYLVLGLLLTAGICKNDLEGPGLYRLIRARTRLRWFLRKSIQLFLMLLLYVSTYILFVGCFVIVKGNYSWANLGTVFLYCLHASMLLWLFALIVNVTACYTGTLIALGIGLLILGGLLIVHMQIVLSADYSDPLLWYDLRFNPVAIIGEGADEIQSQIRTLIWTFLYCAICVGLGAFAIQRKDLSLRQAEA